MPLGSVIVSGIIEKKTHFLQSQIPVGFEDGLVGIFSGAKIESVRRVVEDGIVVLEVEVLAAGKPSGASLEKAVGLHPREAGG